MRPFWVILLPTSPFAKVIRGPSICCTSLRFLFVGTVLSDAPESTIITELMVVTCSSSSPISWEWQSASSYRSSSLNPRVACSASVCNFRTRALDPSTCDCSDSSLTWNRWSFSSNSAVYVLFSLGSRICLVLTFFAWTVFLELCSSHSPYFTPFFPWA